MSKGLIIYSLFVAVVGCVGPYIASRVVHGDSAEFIRLDTFADGQKAAELGYDHPSDLAAGELSGILSRVLVQERKGLLDESPAAQAVFSSDQIRKISPQVHVAFKVARPSEWISFYLTSPTGTPAITSGAFFLTRSRLHIVIANYRERISSEKTAQEVRENPMRSLRSGGLHLMFDPSRYVVGARTNWMAGSGASPTSEMIIDYKAFLEDTRLIASPVASSPISPAQPSAGESPDAFGKLQEEVERLKRRIDEQAEEITQLKKRLGAGTTPSR